ncbi:hypothetical protein AB0H71_06100 [Nocardia sp. NPDC050697]|uniref:hypothetical protein n=1 Tax=Nocardia sp. NPDC050697 TaxID=3155158 RepID=UPI0033F054C0
MALGIALFGSGLVLASRLSDDCVRLHPAVQLSGTSARLQRVTESCALPPLADFRWSLLADSLLIVVGYWLLGTMALVATWWWHEPPGLRRFTPVVMLLPSAAAVLDLVENALSAAFVEAGAAGYWYDPAWAGRVIAAVAWSKWTVLAAVLLIVLALVLGRVRPARTSH